MPKLFLLFTLLLPLTSLHAEPEDKGFATRYETTYSTWDPVFTSRYGYSEYDFSTACDYRTCYPRFDYHDTIWVEETVIRRGRFEGHTRVTVYHSPGYDDSDRYVSYYTYHGRVIRRVFHRRHPHIHRHVYVHDHYTHVHYHELDEFASAIIVGAWFFDIGTSVIANCPPRDDACQMLGLASSVSGLAISVSASIQEHHKSELQRELEKYEGDKTDQTLEDSFDEDFALGD